MHKKGFVYLVGAGCGSADLITVRGLRLLQSCDAVVYDDLIDPALLAQAAHAEQHPAGKRCGRHSMPQSEINSLLVRLGQSGKTVVRLKGGDPFVKTNKHGHGTDVQVPKGSSSDVKAKLAQIAAAAVAANNAELGEEA